MGVGASAGGVDAFGKLLADLPADTGMAYVLIQHLAPSHESFLPELLAKHTRLPVTEARDGVELEANHIYAVASGTEITIVDGKLSVMPRRSPATVDVFLRSLARERRERSIGVILAGTGSDGTLGALAIQKESGLVFAQDPATCEHDGMPRSAIAAGAVDKVLAPGDMGAELARVARHAFVKSPPDAERPIPNGETSALRKIVSALDRATGVSFEDYKPNTLVRRSLRRMAIHSIDRLGDYATLVESNAQEAKALFEDVLIHVTSFFRDPSAFEALTRIVFPRLMEPRSGRPVKIWVPGCSSGEEAFSIAIALDEFLETQASRLPFQVFATELDEAQIARARGGSFPDTIVADVSPKRLERYFVEVAGGYQIAQSIRERCVFARHNLLRDPPFSHTDLISCRNVLIYFGTEVQKKLMPTFHYALNPGGHLMLGQSESIGSFTNLFAEVDAEHRIFRRRDVHAAIPTHSKPSQRPSAIEAAPGQAWARRASLERRTDEVLIRKFAPPAVVVDGEGDIVQFRGDTSPFLTPAPGAASLSLLRMARSGLEVALRSAMRDARTRGRAVRRSGLTVRDGDAIRQAEVEVEPLATSDRSGGHLLVTFSTPASDAARRGVRRAAPAARATARGGTAKRLEELERELEATRSHLSGIVADRDDANEKLQAMNEEALSANEELQSINEELATAQEELQSTNEELNTLNEELRNRNADLARLGDDLANLLAGVGAPVIVVDRDLTVRRVSPGAEDVFRTRPPDLGLPLGASARAFDFRPAEPELRTVIEHGLPGSVSIARDDGRRFLMRIQPYRSGRTIDGAVLVLVDVEELERNVTQRTSDLQASNERMVMFSYSVAHDLRAPVRAMRGYAETLLADAVELEEAHRDYCHRIVESASRLDSLIQGLLSFSRVGSIELLTGPVSLAAAMDVALRDLHADLAKRGAEVIVMLPPNTPDVLAHEETLAQVIANLVSNASKFVDPGIVPRVHVSATENAAMVRLWVEDNGIGIQPAHQQRIFRVFERLHASDRFPGVGIGLAFVKQAVIRMGGSVGLESTPGRGSRFWIELPRADATPVATP